jgi:uncharacterized protein YhhL (DUF1145 family)
MTNSSPTPYHPLKTTTIIKQTAHEMWAILLVDLIRGFPLCFFLSLLLLFSVLVEDDKT